MIELLIPVDTLHSHIYSGGLATTGIQVSKEPTNLFTTLSYISEAQLLRVNLTRNLAITRTIWCLTDICDEQLCRYKQLCRKLSSQFYERRWRFWPSANFEFLCTLSTRKFQGIESNRTWTQIVLITQGLERVFGAGRVHPSDETTKVKRENLDSELVVMYRW